MATTDAGEVDAGEGLSRRRSRYKLRTGMLAVVVVGVWLGIVIDPVFGPITWWVFGGLGLTLGVLLAAVGLSWLGFGLFAAGDRVAGWLKRASNWPEA